MTAFFLIIFLTAQDGSMEAHALDSYSGSTSYTQCMAAGRTLDALFPTLQWECTSIGE